MLSLASAVRSLDKALDLQEYITAKAFRSPAFLV